MRHRSNTTPVLALLARLGWQRDEHWTVPCRDDGGRRCRLRVGVATDGVRVGSRTLTPLQVGRLRGALADALLTYTRLRPDNQPDARDRAVRHAA